jgi:hypothetical protein
MKTKHIVLLPGERLIIDSTPSEPIEPPQPEEDLHLLLKIGSVNIYTNPDKTYCSFLSDLDICNDGCGPAHGDQYHQPQTAYYSGGIEGNKYLNADLDRYIVVPPQIRSKLPGIVMGAKGQVTNMDSGASFSGVIGDIGPSDKTGETAYALAKLLNPTVTHNSGDSSKIYLYELWPDVPATQGDFTYKLQPA